MPLKDEIASTLKVKPKLLERKKVIPRVLDKIVSFVEKFYDDIGTQTTINNDNYSNSVEKLNVAQPKPEYNSQVFY